MKNKLKEILIIIVNVLLTIVATLAMAIALFTGYSRFRTAIIVDTGIETINKVFEFLGDERIYFIGGAALFVVAIVAVIVINRKRKAKFLIPIAVALLLNGAASLMIVYEDLLGVFEIAVSSGLMSVGAVLLLIFAIAGKSSSAGKNNKSETSKEAVTKDADAARNEVVNKNEAVTQNAATTQDAACQNEAVSSTEVNQQ